MHAYQLQKLQQQYPKQFARQCYCQLSLHDDRRAREYLLDICHCQPIIYPWFTMVHHNCWQSISERKSNQHEY